MLQLYHSPTAICAAKVRVTLAEKRLEWSGVVLDLNAGDQFQADYLRLNPSGVVPTLIHEGRVLVESTVINEYLDEAFPQWPLRPVDVFDRARMRLWTKREDAFHAAVNTLTNAMVFRLELLAASTAERQARVDSIPEPLRRAKWSDIIEHGMDSTYVRDAMVFFGMHVRDMQNVLDSSLWLGGAEFSLADIGLISFFYRLQLLHLDFMWKDHTKVHEWFSRCKERPSFEEGVARYISPAHLERYARPGSLAKDHARRIFSECFDQFSRASVR